MTLVLFLASGFVAAAAEAPSPVPTRIPLEILRVADGADVYVCITITTATDWFTLGKELAKDEFRLFVGSAKHMTGIPIQHVFRSRYTAGLYLETSQGTLYVPYPRELYEDVKGYVPMDHIVSERLTDPKWGEKPLEFLDPRAFVVSETSTSASIEPKGQK